jgi:hypothetical protein
MTTKYEQFFHDADADKDGLLTVEELTAALRQYGFKDSDEKIAVSILHRLLPLLLNCRSLYTNRAMV